jgi:hypothetical protein
VTERKRSQNPKEPLLLFFLFRVVAVFLKTLKENREPSPPVCGGDSRDALRFHFLRGLSGSR